MMTTSEPSTVSPQLNKPPFFANDTADIQAYIAQLRASVPPPVSHVTTKRSLFARLTRHGRMRIRMEAQRRAESRLAYEGVVLPGEIVWHDVKTYRENYEYRGHGGHSDFPLDDCTITRLLFRYTFTPPHAKPITGHFRKHLHLYYFGDNAALTARYPTPVAVDYAAIYAELTGSPVFVLYLDDNYFQLI